MTAKEAKSVLETFVEINGGIELPLVMDAVEYAIRVLDGEAKREPPKVVGVGVEICDVDADNAELCITVHADNDTLYRACASFRNSGSWNYYEVRNALHGVQDALFKILNQNIRFITIPMEK